LREEICSEVKKQGIGALVIIDNKSQMNLRESENETGMNSKER